MLMQLPCTTRTKALTLAINFGVPLLQPEFWLKTGIGGWTEGGDWVPGFEGYAPYFNRVASTLNPCEDPEGPQLSGPGWGESINVLADYHTYSCVLRGL